MKKIIDIKDENVEPLKIRAIKSSLSFAKFLTDLLSEMVKPISVGIQNELKDINKKKPDLFREMSYISLSRLGIKDVVNGELIFED